MKMFDEYPIEVQKRISAGWRIISETDYSILLGAGNVRMSFDKTNKTFSRPYEATVLK